MGREGSGGVVGHLLGNLDEESEGKTTQKYIFILEVLKCDIN